MLVLPPYLVELAAPALPIGRQDGVVSKSVRRVQEWLTLHGFATGVDGEFGPGTAAAVRAFQKDRGIGETNDPTGVVDLRTWGALSAPLVSACAIPGIVEPPFGELVCRVARQFLGQKAREVGGDNMGVWQRYFARGRENQPWCQDFASSMWLLAAYYLKTTELPFDLIDGPDLLKTASLPSSYVPWVANSARRHGKLRSRADDLRPVPVGSMFFVPSSEVPYCHVGIVTKDDGDVIETIEGNTNTDGSSNGYEVAARFRRKASCDYGVST